MPTVTAQAELPKSTSKVDAMRQVSTDKAEQGGDAPVEAATEEKKEDFLSPKFAALAKQQKAIRRQEQAVKAREEALKAKEAEYSTQYVSKSRLKAETLAALSESGVTPDDLTQMFLNAPKAEDPTIAELRAQIKTLIDGQNQVNTKIEEKTTAEYQQAVTQIRNETKLLVDSDPNFELIKDLGQTDAVVELIEETFKADNVLMSVEEAAKEIEAYLFDEALKMANLKKIKAKLNPEPVIPAQVEKPQFTQKPQMKTLTNATTSQARPLSARERAIAAFKGQLK